MHSKPKTNSFKHSEYSFPPTETYVILGECAILFKQESTMNLEDF